MGKDVDGLDGVQNFKTKHTCHAMCVTDKYIVIGGTKRLHFFDKNSHANISEIKTGGEITSMCLSAEGHRLHLGFADGSLKTVNLAGETPPETCESSKKFHTSSIVELEHGEDLYCACNDGAVSVWNHSGLSVGVRAKSASKKGCKNIVAKFFPSQQMSCIASAENTLVFRGNDFNDARALVLDGLGARVTAMTGHVTSLGVRLFVGMENGAINAFDIAPTATEGGPRSQEPMCLLDDTIHSKAIHRMEMFGPYLCAAAHDKLVSMWNGKENATQCYLLRKLRHKGLFTNMGVDDTSLWCFDESNKKVYKIVMADHIPTLQRTHHRQQTFDVSDNATLAIEAALTPLRQRESMTSIPDLTRSMTSDLHLADPHPNTSPSAAGAGAGAGTDTGAVAVAVGGIGRQRG
eukprot:Rhum_TRINITY_DN14517_c1_g1::Rhum_TRINITY_DN14517_c1_g1_i1::g.95234::m.95234